MEAEARRFERKTPAESHGFLRERREGALGGLGARADTIAFAEAAEMGGCQGQSET